MHRDVTLEDKHGEPGLAGLEPSVSQSAACGPMQLGDVVALVVSDLGVRRKAAPVDLGREKEGRVLQFAAPISTSQRPVRGR